MAVFPLLLVLTFWTSDLVADERVAICHGYGCLVQSPVVFSEARLGGVRATLAAAVDAVDERRRLANVIGQLYAWAGEQSDIHNDRGGNYADAGVPGRMDCIDHSQTTSRFLTLLAERRYVRFHRVLEPVVRYWAYVFPAHWSAQLEEIGSGRRFVVDSWFVDNGQPAVVLPLEDWKEGAGPDV